MTTNRKYELVTTERDAAGLYRIRALRDIPRWGVRAGDLGGWVAGEHNLSQEGDCWVSGNARVSGNASVFGDAWVSSKARVFGDAHVSGNALVSGNARVSGNASVFGDAHVSGNASVFGDAWVSSKARVFGDASVFGTDRVTHPPMTLRLGGFGHHITVTDNNVNIGCEQHPLEHWLENFREIGYRHGYSQKGILLFQAALRLVRDYVARRDGEEVRP